MFYEEYQRKHISAEEAAKLVRSGNWIDYGWCACHTRAFDRALAARAEVEALQDVKVRGGVLMWMPEIFKIKNPASSFFWNSWHFSGLCRKIAESGKGFYASIRYSEVPRYYRENISAIDLAVCQVTPMDQHGYFNFSVSTSHQRAVFDVSNIKIVEVNANLPVCLGGFENVIHISEIDFIIEGDNPPMVQLPAAQPCETDAAVARLVLEEIPSGACLQLGVGGMPNAVGSMIAKSDLKDLGVHTEMYVDAFVDMAMAGKITGAKKNIDKGRQSFAFAAGTEKTYNYLHQNPACMACPVDYTNDPCIVGQLDNFISINSCVEVDLFGQVNSESSGYRHISGTGGQLDFVIGAYLSNGGKSFVCMTSTHEKQGVVKSRVVPALSSGSIVTDPRASIQWIVTEYGKINLKGMTTWERAEALIGIAAPMFREDLIKQAETMKIWRKSNKR